MLTTAPKPAILVRRTLRGIFTRYAIGSVLAGVASEAVLLLTYGPGLLGPRAASVAAWAAGAALNYGLNRRWAWGRRGRAHLRRELLPYWAITLATLAVSTWATGAADAFGHRLFAAGGLRVAFVGGAFLAVYGLMFGVKFALYHYVVFAPRSRHQVPSTTRR
jgi:putative flippase GtrA